MNKAQQEAPLPAIAPDTLEALASVEHATMSNKKLFKRRLVKSIYASKTPSAVISQICRLTLDSRLFERLLTVMVKDTPDTTKMHNLFVAMVDRIRDDVASPKGGARSTKLFDACEVVLNGAYKLQGPRAFCETRFILTMYTRLYAKHLGKTAVKSLDVYLAHEANKPAVMKNLFSKYPATVGLVMNMLELCRSHSAHLAPQFGEYLSNSKYDVAYYLQQKQEPPRTMSGKEAYVMTEVERKVLMGIGPRSGIEDVISGCDWMLRPDMKQLRAAFQPPGQEQNAVDDSVLLARFHEGCSHLVSKVIGMPARPDVRVFLMGLARSVMSASDFESKIGRICILDVNSNPISTLAGSHTAAFDGASGYQVSKNLIAGQTPVSGLNEKTESLVRDYFNFEGLRRILVKSPEHVRAGIVRQLTEEIIDKHKRFGTEKIATVKAVVKSLCGFIAAQNEILSGIEGVDVKKEILSVLEDKLKTSAVDGKDVDNNHVQLGIVLSRHLLTGGSPLDVDSILVAALRQDVKSEENVLNNAFRFGTVIEYAYGNTPYDESTICQHAINFLCKASDVASENSTPPWNLSRQANVLAEKVSDSAIGSVLMSDRMNELIADEVVRRGDAGNYPVFETAFYVSPHVDESQNTYLAYMAKHVDAVLERVESDTGGVRAGLDLTACNYIGYKIVGNVLKHNLNFCYEGSGTERRGNKDVVMNAIASVMNTHKTLVKDMIDKQGFEAFANSMIPSLLSLAGYSEDNRGRSPASRKFQMADGKEHEIKCRNSDYHFVISAFRKSLSKDGLINRRDLP